MEPVIEFTSPDAKPIYACGHCRMLSIAPGHRTKEEAAQCCQCAWPGCAELKGRYIIYCEAHRAEKIEQDRRDRLAKQLALPVVEWDGECWLYYNDEYFESLDEVAEQVAEGDELNPIIHPCYSERLGCIDLADRVLDAWTDGWTDCDQELSAEAKAALEAAETIIANESPTVWYPLQDRRIILPSESAGGA